MRSVAERGCIESDEISRSNETAHHNSVCPRPVPENAFA
jgi:hypothetical protein